MLEPQDGDFVIGLVTYPGKGSDSICGIVSVSQGCKPHVRWVDSDYSHEYRGEPIIQRGGIAFMWPESE
ncbi:hypothetical protein FRUB_04099 [Fimbriiglobus ruber]|uniref:Uncharacterized protein n=1 Tax=Fimbriiglobus ruber TaxID=1908690 RepID=A0A225DKQ2_9BACT|nr:hypothetical protein FRUB_04099 [Fimbriiglobus ruber]